MSAAEQSAEIDTTPNKVTPLPMQHIEGQVRALRGAAELALANATLKTPNEVSAWLHGLAERIETCPTSALSALTDDTTRAVSSESASAPSTPTPVRTSPPTDSQADSCPHHAPPNDCGNGECAACDDAPCPVCLPLAGWQAPEFPKGLGG